MAASSATPPGATAADRRFLDRHGDRLSKTTHRAKWTHEAAESPDRKGQTLATRSHDVIRSWAERRKAVPATATRGPDGAPRVLRFDFMGDRGNGRSGSLEHIEWDEWFGVFDRRDLVFLYQETLRNGNTSNFFRLDNPRRSDA